MCLAHGQAGHSQTPGPGHSILSTHQSESLALTYQQTHRECSEYLLRHIAKNMKHWYLFSTYFSPWHITFYLPLAPFYFVLFWLFVGLPMILCLVRADRVIIPVKMYWEKEKGNRAIWSCLLFGILALKWQGNNIYLLCMLDTVPAQRYEWMNEWMLSFHSTS